MPAPSLVDAARITRIERRSKSDVLTIRVHRHGAGAVLDPARVILLVRGAILQGAAGKDDVAPERIRIEGIRAAGSQRARR